MSFPASEEETTMKRSFPTLLRLLWTAAALGALAPFGAASATDNRQSPGVSDFVVSPMESGIGNAAQAPTLFYPLRPARPEEVQSQFTTGGTPFDPRQGQGQDAQEGASATGGSAKPAPAGESTPKGRD
jgi:hypothetical protein